MNRSLYTLIACLALQGAHAGIWDQLKSAFVAQTQEKPPTIRVLVLTDLSQVQLEVRGTFNVYDPFANAKLSSRFSPKQALCKALSYGIKWGEEFPGVYQIRIVPDDLTTSIVLNGIEYKGEMSLYVVDGKLSCVNEVLIEDYVASVLSSLFSHPLSKEAMNALTIAARTDAYYTAKHARNPYWHVDATSSFYQGFAVTQKNNGVLDSVHETRHMVLNTASGYRGPSEISPFPTRIVLEQEVLGKESAPKISSAQAEALASQGSGADAILSQVFPGTHISLTHDY